MAANEYLSLREWSAAVEHLCVQRLKTSITMIPEVTVKDMEEAWQDGVTPEEYFVCDIQNKGKDEP